MVIMLWGLLKFAMVKEDILFDERPEGSEPEDKRLGTKRPKEY
jgi:hypothetical protein